MYNFSMLKRALCIIISIIMIFGLVACGGGPNQVPDAFIEFEVNDFITYEEFDEPYTYEAKHSYNSETHMDTVDITVKIEYGYGDRVYTGRCVYYYDRASDIWECYRNALGSWNDGEDQFIERYIEKHYTNTDAYSDSYVGIYDINVEDVDFNNSSVTCNYYIKVRSTWGGDYITASGQDTFEIIDGYKFYIPFDNGRFEFIFSLYEGVSQYFRVKLN